MMSSRDQTWNTPRWFVERIERALGPIGLDPCSNRWSEVNARIEYRREPRDRRNGLALPWGGMGLVYVNPPFGRQIEDWMLRCETSAMAGDAEVIALVPARVDTRWWHRAHSTCAAVVLWRGRFCFRRRAKRTNGNAPFPSSLFYWGNRRDEFIAEFSRDGITIPGGLPDGLGVHHG